MIRWWYVCITSYEPLTKKRSCWNETCEWLKTDHLPFEKWSCSVRLVLGQAKSVIIEHRDAQGVFFSHFCAVSTNGQLGFLLGLVLLLFYHVLRLVPTGYKGLSWLSLCKVDAKWCVLWEIRIWTFSKLMVLVFRWCPQCFLGIFSFELSFHAF